MLLLPDSLSELREYSEGHGEPADADDCAPASGQSVISLLSSEELKTLIEEVKVLDEATLKQLDSTQVTVLHKEEGAGLGFSLAGGSDLESKVITVSGQRQGPGTEATGQEGALSWGREERVVPGCGRVPRAGAVTVTHVTPSSPHHDPSLNKSLCTR